MDYKEKVIALLNDQELSKEQKEKLENIFPELKENESEDERIKKAIIRILKGEMRYVSKEDADRYITWLEKQGNPNTFEVSETSIKDAEEVTSRMQYIEDDMKPIAEFIINYANWNLHKDEWNQPTLTVPLFRVLDALIQRGKPYGECVQSIEEQGEKKPVDKVEPKFKAGNWYQCTKNFFGKGVTFDKNTAYYCAKEGCLQDEYGCHIAIVKDLYDNFKLWTIKDAKDGDILACRNGWTCIFKRLNDNVFSSHCFMDSAGWFCETGGQAHVLDNIINCHPATKEQRELLFTKLKESGHEWDADKKEIRNTL